ncbi:homoserine dehydrogenase [Aquibacillus kalidii]|uniref:homoserine dehydrogenase n=1 Tax=Aquibacillus kalidii TaxID=2762597 RepID=UPI001647312E|nr:homoserine dehydrogenase [Aquibacillus kalidii]
MTLNIAFIGFGGVGQALADMLFKQKDRLSGEHGLDIKVVAVTDMMKGAIYHPDGLDIQQLLNVVHQTNRVDTYPDQSGLIKGLDSIETIRNTNADMIVEVTFTDVETGQPAIDHIKTAFQNKKSVVTTNKGPVALAYEELLEIAKENDVYWGFEGTVMSGTPALRMPITALAGNEIKEIRGILNGTTNYILSEMEQGFTYEDALQKAQNLGYAEADPTSDVEGYDARYKAAILSHYLMETPIHPKNILCNGISNITGEMVQQAKQDNKRWKLLARITKKNGEVNATVKPELLDSSDPLAAVSGPTNAIMYKCDLAGPILLTGAGAGLVETGYALLMDLIHYHQEKVRV